ncbi:hypothetical protein FQN54_006786 [Arachnomyces sp. PD_36]|nr:hypothetical protein FQN54_006786 [Arachnomyces sp. PD_36]
MWFGPNFLSLTVTFPGPNSSTWQLKEQISENFDQSTQIEFQDFDMIPEVRGVFICSKVSGNGPKEAVMKVIMQIPWKGTEMQPAEKRKLQRGMSESVYVEALALERLTRARCSSTPMLLGNKVVKQAEDMWVPGGYLGFIVMTRLPGVTIPCINRLSEQEAREMARSFKKAWFECHEAGVVPIDHGLWNLLWDAKHKKCYIVDFGEWIPSSDFGPWYDELLLGWNLQE